MTLTELFSNIANAIRSKTGGTSSIKAEDFPAAISGISVGVEGGIIPSGTKEITSNGTHRVYEYENAEVNVPIPSGYIKPSGTKTITSNGTHDVTSYASASVNVPVGIAPSGSISITENGTYDVTEKASAVVNVPTPEQNLITIPITISADMGAGTTKNYSLITGNAFVKAHYADEAFFVMLVPLFAADMVYESGVLGMIYHGNRVLVTSKSEVYGVAMKGNGSSTHSAPAILTAKVNGNGYSSSFRVNSSGDINIYVANTFTVPAGNYLIVLGLIN